MTEEIKSVLGFDISGALSALATLDTALKGNWAAFKVLGEGLDAFNAKAASIPTSFANISASAKQATASLQGAIAAQKSLSTLGTSGASGTAVVTSGGTQSLNSMLGMASAAKETEQAVTAVDMAVTSAGNAGTKAGTNMTLSWQTFARVVQTQMLIRGINEIRDALEFSVTSFIAFSRQLARIGSINPERSFTQISDDLRKMSDSFNQPILKVAEAEYQTLSAQFTSTADRVNILTSSNALAKTTNQELAATTLLITGALNTFGESSDNAGLRAAQFFKTTELGRVQAGELGTALSRVQGVGNILGVSLEELDAAFVSLSLGGVKASESGTQLRGVMTALLKPSVDMKAAYKELGIESGQAGVATWGFREFLNKLMETTGGAAQELAKLFPNIRGFAGEARLAGAGADKFRDALEKIRDVDMSTLMGKLKSLEDLDAESFTKEINKIKNALTVDLGTSLTSQLHGLIDIFGGAGIGGALTSLLSQVPSIVGGLALMAGGFVLIKTQALLAKAAVGGNWMSGLTGGALTTLVLVPVAQGIGEAIGGIIGEVARKGANEREEQYKQDIKADTDHAAALINTANWETTQIMQLVRQQILDAKSVYQQDVNNYSETMQTEVELTKLSLDKIMSARHTLTSELGSIAKNADTAQANDAKAIYDIIGKMEDENFTRKETHYNNLTTRAKDYGEYSQNLARKAAQMTASALDTDEKAAADAMWHRADTVANTAQQFAKQANNIHELNTLENQKWNEDKLHISSLTANQKTQQDLAIEANKRQSDAQQDNYSIETKKLELEKQLKMIAKEPSGTEKYKKDLDDAQKMANDIVKMTLTDTGKLTKPFLGDPNAFKEIRNQTEKQLEGVELKNILFAPASIEAAFNDLQTSISKHRLEIPIITTLEAQAGHTLDYYGGSTDKLVAAAQKQLGIDEARQVETAKIASNEDKARDAISKSISATTKQIPANNEIGGRTAFSTGNTDETRNQLRDIEKEIVIVGTSSKITQEQIDHLKQSLLGIDLGKAGLTPTAKTAIETEITNQISKIMDLIQYQKQSVEAAKEPIKPIEDQGTAIDDDISACDNLINSWYGVADAIMTATEAAQNYSTASNNQYASLGGRIDYFAKGGARGIDSIPAMLAPGEIVMNPQASQKFASQLVAMNAGINPSYRSTGGSVSNTGISGDVNVSVTGTSQPHETARAVVSAINREMRRGTSKLRN